MSKQNIQTNVLINFDAVKMGQRVKELREKSGLSQAKLAERVGVALNVIKRLEGGLVNRGYLLLIKLAVALNSSPDYLLGLED